MAVGESPPQLIDEAIVGGWLDDLIAIASQPWCRARRDDPESMRAGAPSLGTKESGKICITSLRGKRKDL